MAAGWTAVVSAFFGAGASLTDLLRSDEVGERWSEPSLLGGYTVGAVAAHVVQATERLGAVLEEEERRPRP